MNSKLLECNSSDIYHFQAENGKDAEKKSILNQAKQRLKMLFERRLYRESARSFASLATAGETPFFSDSFSIL